MYLSGHGSSKDGYEQEPITFSNRLLLKACLHGGGEPQIGEVACGGSPHLSSKRDQIKMRDYMDRQVTPPKRVTSPTCSPPPPCRQTWDYKPNFKQGFLA